AAELRALRRECWLRGALPIVARIDALARRDGQPGARFPELADALESPGAMRGPAVITAIAGTDLPDFRRRVVRVRVDAPAPRVREKLWAVALGAVPEGGLSSVAHRFAMTPGVIRRAAANARMLAAGRALTLDDVQ